MCYFYWLINKAASGQWLNRVKAGGKSEQRCRERVDGIREKSYSHHRIQMPPLEPVEPLLVDHNFMVMLLLQSPEC